MRMEDTLGLALWLLAAVVLWIAVPVETGLM
jgi:hypothetical protein